MEQCVGYGAASAGAERGELQLVSNTETSCGLEGEKMMKWPLVKLLSINTSVGSREQAAGRVDSGPVARLNQHRRRVSSSPANVPSYQPETQLTFDIDILSVLSDSFVIPACPTVSLLISIAGTTQPREPLLTAPRCCRGPEVCLLPPESAPAALGF